MIYFGNRQVGKTHTAITKLSEAYAKKKGIVQVVAPTHAEANHLADMLIRRGVDKSDIVTFDKLTDVIYKYRLIEGLDRIIGDNEDTFAVVDNSTFVLREDKMWLDFKKEHNPQNVKVFINTPLTQEQLLELQLKEKEAKIKALESEIERLKK